MAKFSGAEATAIGEAYGRLLKEAAEAENAAKRRSVELRVEGFLEALALSRIGKANTRWDYWDSRSLKAANSVLRAAKLPERTEMPIPYLSTPSTGTAKSSPKGTKTRSSKKTAKAETPETPKVSRPRPDHYVIDEGQQCLGKTKAAGNPQCKHWGINGTGYCLQHWDQIPEESVPAEQPPKEAAKSPSKKGTARTVTAQPPKKRSETALSADELKAELAKGKPAKKPATASTKSKSLGVTVTTRPLTPEESAKYLTGSKTPSTREKLVALRQAEAAQLSEAELAEAQAEADFLEEAKASSSGWLAKQAEGSDEVAEDIDELADEVGTTMAKAIADAAQKAKLSGVQFMPSLAKPDSNGDELAAKRQEKKAEGFAALGLSEADVALMQRLNKLEELVVTMAESVAKLTK